MSKTNQTILFVPPGLFKPNGALLCRDQELRSGMKTSTDCARDAGEKSKFCLALGVLGVWGGVFALFWFGFWCFCWGGGGLEVGAVDGGAGGLGGGFGLDIMALSYLLIIYLF